MHSSFSMMLHRAMHQVRKTPSHSSMTRSYVATIYNVKLSVELYLGKTTYNKTASLEAVLKLGSKMINCATPSRGGMSDLVKISRSSSLYRLVSSVIHITTQMYSLDYSHKSNLSFNMLDFMLDSQWVSFFYIFVVTGHLINFLGAAWSNRQGIKASHCKQT